MKSCNSEPNKLNPIAISAMNTHTTKILLVDDDADDLYLFIQALEVIDPSIRLMYAGDGISALKMLYNRDIPLPDYIFLDLNMHRMNGKECLEEMKSSSYLSAVPVIICTTSKRESDVKRTRDLGASGFFTKPDNFEELVMGIRFILDEKPAEGQYLNSKLEVF
jgi:DNA-binding response OmpR family regulator